MKSTRHPLKALTLLATASLVGVSSLNMAPPVNAIPYQNIATSLAKSAEYHPTPQYYTPGTLAYTHSRINVRTGPGTKYYAKHYGLKGDRVTVMNSEWGHDGYQWWYLRFNQSGAKGWVREDLVELSH